jgi:H+-transporting ATPase
MEEITMKVARRLTMIVVASLIGTIVYALLTGFQLEVLVPLVAILLVASVPVAMPTVFTLNMALGSLALAKKGVVVTRLSASEDAAAMDVLCTDKTGTITMNKLFVEDQSALNGFRNSDVLLYGALASNEADQDPIDLAFLAAAAEADLSLDTYSQTEFVPFDPKTRMTEAAIQKSGEKFFVRKGSVNAVCSSCQMSDKDTSALKKSVEAFSSKGLRVIAVAKGDHRSRLQLVGFTGVADKIRESSHQTVNQIRDLGVSVKMLTGDSLPIAKNIAQHIGLGDKISTMPKTNETSLGSAIEDSDGIAEIYPEDKYTIVKTLQSSGHIIGMTGDGINDAPALKQAQVGIAVANATDIAKDSASAVLTAEGLGGIVTMIKTGTTIYQRILSWVLSMITWKIHVVGYIVVMLFLIHYLTFSIFSMVLFLFLADFASMSISTDNVRYSSKPDSLNISWLFKIGLSLGIMNMIEGVLFTMTLLSYFGLSGSVNRLYTFTFAYLVLTGLFTLMIVRERNLFWKSRPSTVLIITMVGEILLVIVISLFGFLELAPLGYETLFGILGYVLFVSFLINDPVKVYLIRKLSNTNYNTNYKKTTPTTTRT